jgi:hypothetical protein
MTCCEEVLLFVFRRFHEVKQLVWFVVGGGGNNSIESDFIARRKVEIGKCFVVAT